MKKLYLFSIVFVLFLILPLILSNINNDQVVDHQVESIQTPSMLHSNAYSTVATALNVTEYANRTDANQEVMLLYNITSGISLNGSASAVLPPSWQGNSVDVTIDNLYENRSWSLNPKFEGPEYSGISRNISKVFKYGNGHTAAIRTEKGDDQILYMAFVFGKVTNATMEYNQSSIQDEILNRTINWINLPASPDILRIDNDGGTSYEAYYDNSLTRLGYTFATETGTSPNFNVLRDRDLIIWCTGTNYLIEDLGASDIPDLLMQYLDQAGTQRVIVSGQYVGYCLDDTNANNQPDAAADNFYENYLSANFLEYDAENNISLGFEGDIIGNNLQFFVNGTGPPPLPDMILANYQNDESIIYNWTSSEFGNDFNEDWYSRREIHGHDYNDSCLLLFLEDESDNGYDIGDKIWVEQEIYINRSEIIWAGINLDYWGWNGFGPYTGSFKLFISVNDTEIYAKSMSEIVPLMNWQNSGMIPISTSPFPIPGPVSIKIGLEVTASINYNPDIKPIVMIDNFKLFLKSKISPKQLNLKMNGVSIEGGIGYGNCTFIPTSPWVTTPVKINFTWSPSDTQYFSHDIIVTFTCDTNLFASKVGQTLYAADPSKTGVLLNTDQGANSSWSFQYYINLPTGYWDHSLMIMQPSDWTFTFVSEPQLPLINKLDECIIGSLTVPTTNMTNSPDGYWRFEAVSPNYVKDIQPQVFIGSQWINSSAFFVTNLTRISCFISNGTGPPPNLAASQINLTIKDPNSQVWYTSVSASYMNGWAIFPNMTIFGTNSSGGLYSVLISWDNNLEAGYKESNFTIRHQTKLSLSKPSDAVVDQVTEVNFGELLLIRLGLNDTDKDQLVKGVDLTLNWSQGGSSVQLGLTDLETGQYEIVLDTSDLPAIDNYTIIVNSYSPYFTNASYILNLVVTSETLLSSPQFPKVIEEWGNNITIQVDYIRALDEVGLNNSVIMANWTLGPHSITEIGSGRYDIEIDLTSASLREYTLQINASKPNCQFKVIKVKIEVKAIGTELISPQYPKLITEWAGSNVSIDIDFHTITYQGINNSLIIINWTQAYSINPVGTGLYKIELNTTLNVQEYILEIKASKAFHQNKTLYIIIKIEGVETFLTSPEFPKITSYWGNNITIQLEYLRALNEIPIEQATISMNWSLGPFSINDLGNGLYTIELDLSYAALRVYKLRINASKINYELKTLTIIIEVKAIETELISPNYPRDFAEWGSNLTIQITFRTALESLGINNSILISNWTGNVVSELGNGLYQIVINASEGIGEYILEIIASKQYHVNKSILITIEVNAIETELLSSSYPREITEWGNNVSILVTFRTVPDLVGIDGAIISSNWTGSIVTPLGNGDYQILLNASKSIGEHLLEIVATRQYYINKTLRITIKIDAIETELISPNYPRITTEWGDNVTIQINYQKISGLQGIATAVLNLNWTGPYSISDLGTGLYQIELNTSWCGLQDYLLEINASRQYYETRSLRITIEIKPIITELTSPDYPRVIGEYNINHTIEIDYHTVDLKGIPNAIILVNWTSPYYTINDLGTGIYQIEINTSWCVIQKYYLAINTSQAYHENKTILIIVDVSATETELISPNYPREIQEWNKNVTIEVTYRAINNLQGINTATIDINWTGSFSISDLGNGVYQIELNTSWCELKDYLLEINASKLYYETRTLRITIEIDPIATELTSPDYPRRVGEWNSNITLTLNYHRIDAQGIDNSLITTNWTAGYYSIVNLGGGIYTIEINTSICNLQEYLIEINTSKPHHENKTLRITIEIKAIETDLTSPNYPRVIIEWNINTTIEIEFVAVNGLQGVLNAIISLNWSLGYYSLSALGNGIYQIELNSSWCTIQQYVLEINIAKSQHQNKTLRINVDIHAAETDLTSPNYPREVGERGFNITIEINFRLATNLNGINTSVITINWALGYYQIVELGNGIYHIELNTSWCSIREYTLQINASKQYHYNKSINIAIDIRAVETELISSAYPRVSGEWGHNITIAITFRAATYFTGIEFANIAVNWTSNFYTITEIGAGLYQIELNTSWCNIGEHYLQINSSKIYHYNKSIQITVQINLVETKLSYQSITTVPYGQNVTIQLKYTDFGGSPIESAGDGSDIISINATHTISYNASSQYPYSLTIDTAGLQVTDLLNITASKINFKIQTVFIILTYRPIFTSLSNLNQSLVALPIKESTSIFIFYNDTEYNLGIENANITFYGYNNLTYIEIGNGNYQIVINAGNLTQSYNILITLNRAGYLEKSIQFIVQVRALSEFVEVNIPSDVETEPVGGTAYYSFVIDNEYTGGYFDDTDISVIYNWKYGTGALTYNGNGNFSLILDTTNVPPGTYSIVINVTSTDGELLYSKTVTLVVTGEPLSWIQKNSWIFGVLGAAIAVVAGYKTRNWARQRNWEKKVQHIYVLNKSGVPLYDKRLAGISATEVSLVTSALIGITSIIQEIVHSKRALKTIDHMDRKILFNEGHNVIVAVLSDVDLPVIRKKIFQFTNRFEFYYQKELVEWKGDVDVFFGTNKIINEFFPIEEYIEDKEISAEYMLQRLFEFHGLSGLVTLLMIDLGLKDSKQIAAGGGMKEKLLPTILRTLQDLLLIDKEHNLTKMGRQALSIYKERKEKYVKVLGLLKRKENL